MFQTTVWREAVRVYQRNARVRARGQLACLAAAALLGACGSPAEPTAAPQTQPNILIILTDDLGYGDLGCQGNPIVKTPHHDQLAAQSLQFESFYVSPVCSPTRAALLTGRYGLSTGIFNTFQGGSVMATEQVTLAEVLSSHGWRTGLFGKWHLGDAPPYRPEDQGFQQTLYHTGGGLAQPSNHYANYVRTDSCYFDPVLRKNGRNVKTQGYVSDVLTTEAIEFMASSQEPFFCYLAYNAPHTPLQVPQEYLDQYPWEAYPADQLPLAGSNVERMDDEDVDAARRVYAMVTNLDDNLGRIKEALREAGKAENTVIVWMSDNGPQHRRYTAGLRGKKQTMYEGGIRTPAFWHFPAAWAADTVPQVAAHLDVMPTLLDWLGIATDTLAFHGVSLADYLAAPETPPVPRQLHWQWGRGYPQEWLHTAIRLGDYKLVAPRISHAPLEELELYHLPSDPYEQRNLVDSLPEKVSEMVALHQVWMQQMYASPALVEGQPAHLGLTDTLRLNRNDWWGAKIHDWKQETGFGSWQVYSPNADTVDVVLHMAKPQSRNGTVRLRLGRSERYQYMADTTFQWFTFHDVPVAAGTHRLDAFFRTPHPERGAYGPYEVFIID